MKPVAFILILLWPVLSLAATKPLEVTPEISGRIFKAAPRLFCLGSAAPGERSAPGRLQNRAGKKYFLPYSKKELRRFEAQLRLAVKASVRSRKAKALKRLRDYRKGLKTCRVHRAYPPPAPTESIEANYYVDQALPAPCPGGYRLKGTTARENGGRRIRLFRKQWMRLSPENRFWCEAEIIGTSA